jgi:hypothetical protein
MCSEARRGITAMAKSKRGKNAGKGNGGATGAEKAVAFAKRLILFRWLLSLFGVETLEALAGLGQFPRRRVGVRRVDLGSFRDATDVIGWRYDHAAARP